MRFRRELRGSGDEDGVGSRAGLTGTSLSRTSRPGVVDSFLGSILVLCVCVCGCGCVSVCSGCTKGRGVEKNSWDISIPPSIGGGENRGKALRNSGSSGAGNAPNTADDSSITPSVSKLFSGVIAILLRLVRAARVLAPGNLGLSKFVSAGLLWLVRQSRRLKLSRCDDCV